MSKSNDIKWAYIYSDGCGPCQRITPLVDTIIAMGNTNVVKIDWKTAPDTLKRVGTPFIALINTKTNEMVQGVKTYNGGFWSGFFDLYQNHSELLCVNVSPVEYMVKLFSETKPLDISTITK